LMATVGSIADGSLLERFFFFFFMFKREIRR
jgi:hypothetical protein